jgi:hypothetical protein
VDVNAESSLLQPANRDGGIDQDWAGDDQDWWDWYVTLPIRISARPRTRGDARSTQRRMSSRNTRPARPVRGCPWNSRRCTPTVLAAGRCPLYVHAHGHIGGRLHGQPRTRSAEPADLCKPAGRTLCPRAHPAKADVRRGKADEPLTGGGYHPMPGIPGLGRLFRHR